MSKEAMKLALEALKNFKNADISPVESFEQCETAITALREALAAQQEPVACAQIVSLNDMQGVVDWLPHNGAHLKAGDYLYKSLPASKPWVGLTPEEVETLWAEWKGSVCLDHKTWASAIEAKLKEKNT